MLKRTLQSVYRNSRTLQRAYKLIPASLRMRITPLLATQPPNVGRFPANVFAGAIFSPNESHGDTAGPSECKHQYGVNLVGFLSGAFGLGESARQYAKALIAAGVPVSLVDLDVPALPHSRSDVTFEGMYSNDFPHSITVICVNPDWWRRALDTLDSEALARTRKLALWFWELPELPKNWIPFAEEVDGFIAPSSFVERALRKVTEKPIFFASVPVKIPPKLLNRNEVRDTLGWVPNQFVFLTTFDFNSFAARKNPYGVIEAFKTAFPAGPDNDDVSLIIKTSNGSRHPLPLSDLSDILDGDSRIQLYDEVISRSDFLCLLQCADTYVSLHRSEGFGLGMAESMAAGVPVIATGWSGNMDFMNDQNSFPVEYSLSEVREGEYPDYEGNVWATPDIDSAARSMRRVKNDPEIAAAMRAAGLIAIAEKFSMRRTGDRLAQWMTEIGESAS